MTLIGSEEERRSDKTNASVRVGWDEKTGFDVALKRFYSLAYSRW
jgi:hypothetical protein